MLPQLLGGARTTLIFCVASLAIALTIGLLVACLRLVAPRPVGILAAAYVEVFRNTPILLQLYMVYYGLSQFQFVDATFAGIATLSLNYGAYEAENIRAGLQSVDRGQWEAAQTLGMRTFRTLRRVILPQAVRLMIPPVTNDFIYLLKDSAILSLITITELTAVAHHYADQNFDSNPYIFAAILYLCLSYPASQFAHWLERRVSRGIAGAA